MTQSALTVNAANGESMQPRERQILVACIGNIFLGDDGFGVEAARALVSAGLPAGTVLADYGIRGFDLAFALLEPWWAIILIDAIAQGGKAGSLYLLQAESDAGPAGESDGEFNLHAMSPAQVLALARSLGSITAPVYIVGCEPGDFGPELDGRMGLSSAVAAAVPQSVSTVLHLIGQLTSAGDMAAAR